MKLVTTYAAERTDDEYALLKPPICLPCSQLHPDYQIDDSLMMSALTDPSDTFNLSYTPSQIVALKC